jgi:predicted nucleic acid-binding protein
MTTLLDTNILTRMAQPGDPMHKTAADATDELRRQGEVLCVVPQNCYEFWVAATRPTAQNGLGFTPPQAQTELARLKGLFKLLDETAAFLLQWERLVAQYQVSGKNAHDAHLVAAMMVHGISRILTFNVADFQRYQGIIVLDPRQVVTAKPPTP